MATFFDFFFIILITICIIFIPNSVCVNGKYPEPPKDSIGARTTMNLLIAGSKWRQNRTATNTFRYLFQNYSLHRSHDASSLLQSEYQLIDGHFERAIHLHVGVDRHLSFDGCLCFIDINQMYEEEAVMGQLQEAFDQLLDGFAFNPPSGSLVHEKSFDTNFDSDSNISRPSLVLSTPVVKKPFLILLSGDGFSKGPKLIQRLERLLLESWAFLIKDGSKFGPSLMTYFDIQVILLPNHIQREAFQADKALNARAVQMVKQLLDPTWSHLDHQHDNAVDHQTTDPEIGSKPRRVSLAAFYWSRASAWLSSINELLSGKATLPLPLAGGFLSQMSRQGDLEPRQKNVISSRELASVTHADQVARHAFIALDHAVLAANASIDQLNFPESPDAFSRTVSALIQDMFHIFEGLQSDANLTYGNASSTSWVGKPRASHRSFAEDMKAEILFRFLLRLEPLYNRQVQVLRTQVVNSFNEKVLSDDLEITTHIMDDLRQIQQSTMKHFQQQLASLRPRTFPVAQSIWNSFEAEIELHRLLEEFLASRDTQYRILGVLSRGVRKPIDLSFHALLNHPISRDYRQEPLPQPGDRIDFLLDSSSGSLDRLCERVPRSKAMADINTLPWPVDLRKYALSGPNDLEILSNKTALASPWQQLQRWRHVRQWRRMSEFAREMLMFPLAIKNPDVPLSFGKSRKVATPPARDWERRLYGPET